MAIPTNLVTGFLGVGKTTAVIDLLRGRPPGSRWAVLVNEYGEVGIDAALIEGDAPDGVTIREVAGGCVCCATAPYLPVALHFLLIDAQPVRLLIETTGLGHPAKLLDTLRTHYADRLDVRATLCLVDPTDFAKPTMRANPVFAEQVQLADVVVLNKLDTATPELVADFQAWANDLYPPKLLVAGTTHGRLDPAWLDLTASDERGPLFPEAHEASRAGHGTGSPHVAGNPSLNRDGSPNQPPSAHGWHFPPTAVFDDRTLLPFLRTATVTRLKGVFRCRHEWYAVNRAGDATTVTPTAYRRDSRVEAFADAPDWAAFGQQLLACLLPAELVQR